MTGSSSLSLFSAPGGRSAAGPPQLSVYFFSVLGLFGLASVWLNLRTSSSIWQSLAPQITSLDNFLHASLAKAPTASPPPTPKKDSTQPHDELHCEAYGGPSPEAAAEMVYWKHIPSDNQHVSPFKKKNAAEEEYLTFEPDLGGWNNIRMAMETVLALAFAMGRTLVLPPEKEMYLLGKSSGKQGEQQRKHFSFSHFFHMQAIHDEHVGLDIITMEEFLQREAVQGHLRDNLENLPSFPPGNRTKWDGLPIYQIHQLYSWLRSVSLMQIWTPEHCLVAFPASTDPADLQQLKALEAQVLNPKAPDYTEFVGKPVPVNASALDRMRENWAAREYLCTYDTRMQEAKLIHFPADHELEARLLVHFYAFLFFQDWKQDLWMKRFIRDHVRYGDEIQCAAARVVEAVRQRARGRDPVGNPQGHFDSFHIRRGDFQYKRTRVDATEIVKESRFKLTPNTTIFIATDERDKSFFRPMQQLYDVVFLDDFESVLRGVNTNYYGMIDQLVASRGRYFFGCWFSTFTGYINRLRGYHADKEKIPGYEQGVIPSWYYTLPDRVHDMESYVPVKKSFFAREFPTGWRLLDASLDEIQR